MGHMTPVEAPEAVTRAVRELAGQYLPTQWEEPEEKEKTP